MADEASTLPSGPGAPGDIDAQMRERFREDARAARIEQLVPAAGSLEHAQIQQSHREELARIEAECGAVVWGPSGRRQGIYFENPTGAEQARFAARTALSRLGISEPPALQPANVAHAELEASFPTEFRSISPNALAMYDAEIDRVFGGVDNSFERERAQISTALSEAKSPAALSAALGQLSEASTRATAARPSQLKQAIEHVRDTAFADGAYEPGVAQTDWNRGVFSGVDRARQASR
jgi:hypothetical protein